MTKSGTIRDDTTTQGPRPLWRQDDVVRHTGLSARKIWELTKDGSIPSCKIGRCVRYRPGDVEDWLAKLADAN